MIISFQAFSWECKAKELPVHSFINVLTSHTKPINYFENRKLYVTTDGSYINGLLLTIKDMRKFCTILNEEGKVKLTAHELRKNEQVADFNFFIFDPVKSRGMYQHYYHSCSLPAFNVIAKSIYNEILKRYKDIEINKHPGSKEDLKFLAAMRKKYFGTLHWSIIERKGKFEERIRQLRELTAIEFEYKVLETEEQPFEPLYPYLKRAKHTMSFNTGGGAAKKIAAVANWFSEQEMRKAKVVGLDEHGVEVTYKLFNDYDKFATFNYDDLVPSLSLDRDDVENSINNNAVIKSLQQEYADSVIKKATVK